MCVYYVYSVLSVLLAHVLVWDFVALLTCFAFPSDGPLLRIGAKKLTESLYENKLKSLESRQKIIDSLI